MKRVLWLMLMGVWASQMNAGMPQLPESPVDPETAIRETWREAWDQCHRMQSMGNQFWFNRAGDMGGIDEDVRVRHVAKYYYDLEIRLEQLAKMRKAHPDFFGDRNLDCLRSIVYPYKYYPANVYFPGNPLPDEEEEENGANTPLLPGDDAPPFSDDDGDDDSDNDDDVQMHAGHDQEDDDDFAWE